MDRVVVFLVMPWNFADLTCNLIKKRLQHRYFQEQFFYRTPVVAASESCLVHSKKCSCGPKWKNCIGLGLTLKKAINNTCSTLIEASQLIYPATLLIGFSKSNTSENTDCIRSHKFIYASIIVFFVTFWYVGQKISPPNLLNLLFYTEAQKCQM